MFATGCGFLLRTVGLKRFYSREYTLYTCLHNIPEEYGNIPEEPLFIIGILQYLAGRPMIHPAKRTIMHVYVCMYVLYGPHYGEQKNTETHTQTGIPVLHASSVFHNKAYIFTMELSLQHTNINRRVNHYENIL